jgi:hypothetical protein
VRLVDNLNTDTSSKYDKNDSMYLLVKSVDETTYIVNIEASSATHMLFPSSPALCPWNPLSLFQSFDLAINGLSYFFSGSGFKPYFALSFSKSSIYCSCASSTESSLTFSQAPCLAFAYSGEKEAINIGPTKHINSKLGRHERRGDGVHMLPRIQSTRIPFPR